MSSFSSFAVACNSSITDIKILRDAATGKGEPTPIHDDIEDAIGRFSVWAENIGAMQPASSRKSLDYRLRDAPDIRKNIYMALERLTEAAQTVRKIMGGEPQTRDDMQTSTDDLRSTSSLAAAYPKDEIHELSLSMKSSIDTLFRLSMLVRRHRPKGRLPPPTADDDRGSPPEDPVDVRHICDLFPSVRQKPWLVKRLARAMSKRRGYIKYREKHRKLLAHVEDPEAVGEGNDSVDAGTIATTFVDRQESDSQASPDTATTFTSATSFISFIGDDGEEGPGLAIPDVTRMVMYNRLLDYDEAFECPLCRTIQNPANRQEWKKHVFADLEPYVCTFEHCQIASCLFSSRHDWWRHEVENHRQTYRCTICGGGRGDTKLPSLKFKSRTGMEAHICKHHSDTVTESQIEFIVKMCRDPLPVSDSTCPLCPDWPSRSGSDEIEADSAKSLSKHLARHMQQLSLASIPICIGGLEILETPSAAPDSPGVEGEPDAGGSGVAEREKNMSFVDAALAAAGLKRKNNTKQPSQEERDLERELQWLGEWEREEELKQKQARELEPHGESSLGLKVADQKATQDMDSWIISEELMGSRGG